jgi:hypothetical protein
VLIRQVRLQPYRFTILWAAFSGENRQCGQIMNSHFQPNIFVSIFLFADLTLHIPALSSAAGDAHAVQHLHNISPLPRSDAQKRSEIAARQHPANVQLANEARCQQLLQNPRLDVLESGAFEPWFF